MDLKFYTSVPKELELKVRKFQWLIPTIVAVTGKNLQGYKWLRNYPISFVSSLTLCTDTKKELTGIELTGKSNSWNIFGEGFSPYQTSKIEFFAKIILDLKPLDVFLKNSTLDV